MIEAHYLNKLQDFNPGGKLFVPSKLLREKKLSPTGTQPGSRLEEHLFSSLQGLLFTRLHINSLSSAGWAHTVFWSLTMFVL